MNTPISRKRINKSKALLACLSAIAVIAGLTQPAAAQTTYVWTNNTANAVGPWSSGTNWSGGNIPVSGSSTVLVFQPTQNMTAQNDFVGFKLNRLVATGGGSGNKSLTISASSANSNVIEFVQNAGVMPTLVFTRTSTAAMTFSLPFIVTDSLTITSSGSSTPSISGTILNNAGITLTGNSSGNISGKISGTGGIIDQGTWTLSSSTNNYTGDVSVNNGTLTITAVGALGSGTNVFLGVAGTSSGVLRYTGTSASISKNITALGSGGDTINNTGSGVLTLSGTLAKANTILTLAGGNFLVSGQITGGVAGSGTFNSDLVISGGTNAGTTTLTNANNNYVGPTYVYGGATLKNGVGNALPTSTVLTLGGTDNSSGTYDLGGFDQRISGLANQGTGGAVITNSAVSGTNTIEVNNDSTTSNANYNFGGVIQNGSTAFVALTKSGNKSLTLSGVNTYTGATSVSNGTLIVTGTLGNTKVTVGDGTVATRTPTLSGNGTIGGLVVTQNNGSNVAHLAPGVNTSGNFGAIDTLTLSNGLTISAGTNLDFDLAGSSSGDLIKVTGGTLTLNSGITLNIADAGSLGNGTFVLLDYTGASLSGYSPSDFSVGTTPLSGKTYTFANTGSAITLTISSGSSATSTTYTLTTTAGSTNILTGGTTSIASTIQNTGSGTADTLNYSGLSATSGSGGTITGSPTSGGPLAQGNSGTNSGLTFTGTHSGAVVVTAVGSGTNATLNTAASQTGTNTATVTVWDAAGLSASQSGSNMQASNLSGSFRASAKITSDGGLTNNQGFVNVNVNGQQINSGSSITVANFDSTGKLNGTYSATKNLGYDNVTTSGSAITGGTGNTANLTLTATVSGQTAGAGQVLGAPVFSGQKYGTTVSGTSSGFGLTSNISSDPHSPTTATIINGTASAATTVLMSFDKVPAGSEPDNAFRVSDILTLSGLVKTGGTGHDGSTLTDIYVLQLSYDSTATGQKYLGWYDATQNQWVNAVAGNSTGGTYDGTGEYVGSYASYLASLSVPDQTNLAAQLGAFGYDASTHTAWAVVDHESEFAVIPEPGTWGMIISGFGMLIGFQRLRKRRVGT